jgi:hypothetical protein
MSAWPRCDLAAIKGEAELNVAARRDDGTPPDPRIVWHVVVADTLYIRSVRGDAGGWYRSVQRTGTGVVDAGRIRAEVTFTPDASHDDDIDRPYRDTYGNGSPVQAITSPTARATTLSVEPA